MTTPLIPLLCVALVAGVASFARQHQNTPVASQDARSEAIAAPRAYFPRTAWAVDFLRALGNERPSGDTIAFLEAWHRAEGGTAAFNWLNTTQGATGDTCYNYINGACGVRNYPSYETGIQATVETLTNGYYPNTLAGLVNNQPVVDDGEMGTWGTGGGAVRAQLEGTQVEQPPRVSSKCVDPIPDWRQHINVGFYAINCDAWGFQTGCQHFGTDIGGQGEGTPVQAPCSGTYTGCQDNGDSGPYVGKWIEYTADDGAQFLINHFRDFPFCGAAVGTRIEAGAFIGTMRGDANHVHVQVKVNGQLVDFERYFEEHSR